MSLAILKAGGTTFSVLTGTIELPLSGVGGSRLELDGDTLPSGAATLAIGRDDGADPNFFVGTIVQGAIFGGRARITVALGAGKLSGDFAPILPPRQYVAAPQPVPVALIVADILADAGETPAAGALAALGTLSVSRWHRARGTGATALRALLPVVGGWRALPDGAIWVGDETWPTATAPGAMIQADDGDARVVDFAPESADVLPGTIIFGRKVRSIVYSIGAGLRGELYYQGDS